MANPNPSDKGLKKYRAKLRAMPKRIRVNVTLPPDLLKELDGVTDNRSAWLEQAARERLRRL